MQAECRFTSQSRHMQAVHVRSSHRLRIPGSATANHAICFFDMQANTLSQ